MAHDIRRTPIDTLPDPIAQMNRDERRKRILFWFVVLVLLLAAAGRILDVTVATPMFEEAFPTAHAAEVDETPLAYLKEDVEIDDEYICTHRDEFDNGGSSAVTDYCVGLMQRGL